MTKQRDEFEEIASQAGPDSIKPKPKKGRRAPRSMKTPISHSAEQQDKAYGKPKTFRLPENFLDLLEQVQAKYGIKPPQLIQVSVIEYVQRLEERSVRPPVTEVKKTVELDVPDVPEIT